MYIKLICLCVGEHLVCVCRYYYVVFMQSAKVFMQSAKTDQMAEWYRTFASGSVDSGFNSESGQTNDFKIAIHSFPA